MLQNTAIKIGQDVWSLGLHREEEIPEVFLGKQPLEPKRSHFQGPPGLVEHVHTVLSKTWSSSGQLMG